MSFTIRVQKRNILIVLIVGAISALAATFGTIHWLARLMDSIEGMGE